MSGEHLQESSSPSNKLTNSLAIATTTVSLANHRYVKLNVGGRLFSTSIDTLTKHESTFMSAMFSGRMDVVADLDGYILIDRCGKHFEFILNFLRDEDPLYVAAHLADKTELELHEILKEAKFFCIQSLCVAVEQRIALNNNYAKQEPYYGYSVVSMVTSKNDLHKILNSTDKPCIRLLFNRHNNKYSYTNTSDDNLLKNIELFERMAIKFKNRILFIKDTTSTEEICCWYFHGGGRKLAEVCCTSIVYTTEKKQTKVEFPDSRILEEIFVNAVLFESKELAKEQSGAGESLYHNDGEELDDMPRTSITNGPSGCNGDAGGVVSAVISTGNNNNSSPSLMGSISLGISGVCINSNNSISMTGSQATSRSSAASSISNGHQGGTFAGSSINASTSSIVPASSSNMISSTASALNPANIISIASTITNSRRSGTKN